MSTDDTKTEPARGSESDAKAPAAGANGSHARSRARTAAAELAADTATEAPALKMSSAQTAEPCEDCPPSITGRDWSAGLGWLMVGAALALAFIGADLASRGALSRKLGAAGWDESER